MTESHQNWQTQLAELSFEDAYRKLEETVGQLEQGELSLTDAEVLYSQGMELANHCQRLLTEAELRITQVGENRATGHGPAAGDGDEGDDWELPPPLEPDDPSLFEDDAPF